VEIGTGTTSFVQGTAATVTGDFGALSFAANNIASATTTDTTVSTGNVAVNTVGMLNGTHTGRAVIAARDNSALGGANLTAANITVKLQGNVTGNTGTGTATVMVGDSFATLGATTNTSPAGQIVGGFPTPVTSSATNRTVATIMAGTNNTANPINLTIGNWRAKGSASNLNSANTDGHEAALVSDIVDVNFNLGAGRIQTPTYALQMNYDPAMGLIAGSPMLATNIGTAALPNWNGATEPDFGVGANVQTNVHSDFASFFATQQGLGRTLDNLLGSWGDDAAGKTVWAVVNHNSEFAVVPEPSTLALAGLSIGLIGLYARRRKAAKVAPTA